MSPLPASLRVENLVAWDRGLVAQVLAREGIVPRDLDDKQKEDAQGQIVPATTPKPTLSVGTFSGTTKAVTEVFDRAGDRFRSYFDVIGIEASLPQQTPDPEHELENAKNLYQWQPKTGTDADKYPPHLALTPQGPPRPDNLNVLDIFNAMRLLDTGIILSQVLPEKITDFAFGDPDEGATLADIYNRNKELRAEKVTIYKDPNIGDREDWYTDEVFAQQAFTGANPATIEVASPDWIAKFKAAAVGNPMANVIDSADKGFLYVQDASYFRAAVGADPKAILSVKGKDGKERYGTAPVTLFHLQPNGKLHPLAIIVDYRGSIEDSVVIFNKRLEAAPDLPVVQSAPASPHPRLDHLKEIVVEFVHSIDPSHKNSPKAPSVQATQNPQETDWPWRFAKTAHQSADWVRHEAEVHLSNTHLVEEVVIVASHRTLPQDHLVYRILQPHWLKTLALNAAARSTLVPSVITQLIGIESDATYAFIRSAYERFNWTESYVPNDLKRRGFPPELIKTDDRFHNYAYGINVLYMWEALSKFVRAFLVNGGAGFKDDETVAKDEAIKAWSEELRSDEGGQLKSFPIITTLDQLVDAVTMAIHIASPQHTAVNYLQEYYQSFVINKPPALYTPLPTTIKELDAYQEKDLIAALPIDHPQEWLLAAHIPYLLNSPVAAGQDLPTYAVSLYHLTGPKEAGGSNELALQAAARRLVEDLEKFVNPTLKTGTFAEIAAKVDDKRMPPYQVLYPDATAVSILI
jgi:hypothetical protein